MEQYPSLFSNLNKWKRALWNLTDYFITAQPYATWVFGLVLLINYRHYSPLSFQVDYESYDWHCLDPEAESTKQRVADFLIHDYDAMTYQPIAADKYGKYAGHKLYSENIFK